MSGTIALDLMSAVYRMVRGACVLLWPTALLAYMIHMGGAAQVLHNQHLHSILVILILTTVGAGGAMAYACYQQSREPILRSLVIGLAAMGCTFALHGFLGEMDQSHGGVFMTEIGAEARAVLVVILALALFQWQSPPDDFELRKAPSTILISWTAVMLVEALLLVIAQAGQSQFFLRGCETFSIGIGGMSVLFVVLRAPMNQALFRCVMAMFMFMQSSLCFLMSGPWTHVWWLGHVLFGLGVMVLGYAAVLAYMTSQTFVGAKSENEVLDLMRQAEVAAMEAERANTAKSRFMAAASHDLRQPLVPIKLFAELLEVEVREPAQSALVRKLRGAIQSLDDLLGKLLDFSRVESGTVQPRPERVRLGEILHRFHQEFEPVAQEKGVSLRYVPTSVLVRTDRILLEQVLRNLIENAIRYTNEGGIVLGCRARGNMVAISVVDSGQGIPADQQRAIFTEFFQADVYSNDKRLGFGLGLATVDRLCRLLGHPVEVESVPGRGSRFSVVLPRANERRVKQRTLEIKPLPDPGSLRILLVDDDPEVRDGVVTAIIRRGWEPMVATNCREAVDAVLAEGLPDVIVTDLRLEKELCGLDVLAQIEMLGLGPVSAVIITGDASHRRLAEAMRGPWKVLVKPFAADHFYAAVAEAYLRGDSPTLTKAAG